MQVVSDRANKSILVAIDRWQWLAKYKKEIKRTTKLMAHDENNECRVGDLVQVQSSRWDLQAASIYPRRPTLFRMLNYCTRLPRRWPWCGAAHAGYFGMLH